MGELKKGTLNLMWGGVWVPIGEAEFVTTEDDRIEKVVSFTPKEFREEDNTSSTNPG